MKQMALATEVWQFMKLNKKYWLLPLILMILALSGLIVAAQSSAVAPFIYALF
jgi:drug/metabolite transporter superfamily protein YnfA